MTEPIAAMLAAHRATGRRPWAKNVDSLSGSEFEQVTIDGRRHIADFT